MSDNIADSANNILKTVYFEFSIALNCSYDCMLKLHNCVVLPEQESKLFFAFEFVYQRKNNRYS